MATRGVKGRAKSQSAVTAEERRRMIAEAAYYRAQARGFQSDPCEDWLAAEAEIDRQLSSSPGAGAEQAAYDRLRAEVEKGLAAIRDSVDAKAVQDTLERATDRAKRAGKYAAGTINQAADRLKSEIAEAATRMGPHWEAFSDRSASVFEVWRDRGSTFLARAANGVTDWLEQTGRRMERRRFRSGETVGAGDFECAQCGEIVRIDSPDALPPCPKCAHGEFKRSA